MESVAFTQNPANRQVVLRLLTRKLRLKSPKEAESGYEVLQWLYSLDARPNLKGIQNMQRLLSVTNPKVAAVEVEEVVDHGPVERLERSLFYRGLVARQRGK